MEEFITIIGVGKPYNFKPEGVAETLSGCTMWYIPSGDLNKSNYDDNTEMLGYAPVKQTMGTEFYAKCKAVGIPCKAKVTYGMRSRNGQMTLYVQGVDFINGK